ncbi:hypothetical protein [Haliovirga abyssi]|uniref:Uncharacterized protein n=1 Tax=Haliovirga abyssi TaxID=2996794 RepID=A0AAU9E2N7_9FUSO|nr:hypothetical protein [Haliovirga abyssi]BDU50655.1 hypothetical protein HLVA_12240 [Haliovirga abyssi]
MREKIEKAMLEKDYREITEIYMEKGIVPILEIFSEYANWRSYFKIKLDGEIVEKDINLMLPLINNILDTKNRDEIEKNFKIILDNYILKIEREKVKKKIDRLSSKEIDKIEKNFFNLLQKNEQAQVIRYGNELFFRNKEKFYETILFYSLINNKNKTLPLIVLSMINIIEKVGKENYFYPFIIGMRLLGRYPNEFNEYEEAVNKDGIEYDEISKEIETEKIDIENYGYLKGLKYFNENFNHPKKNIINILGMEYIEKRGM